MFASRIFYPLSGSGVQGFPGKASVAVTLSLTLFHFAPGSFSSAGAQGGEADRPG